MKLTQAQLDGFNKEGFIFLPEAFSAEEVDALSEGAVEIFSKPRCGEFPRCMKFS